ncbi:MAG: hypothetical protein M3O67_07155 [Bacteroidota bacterium]|nr:hypothetical protein [Bacteroidota bacterium]
MFNCFYIKTLFYRATTIVLFLFFALLSSHGQTNSLDTIQNQFDEYQQHSLQEKLFIHTDRNLYVAGEIIWFKIYCVDATKNELLNLSKVAYVEVLDKNLQPVLQVKISMKDGMGSGSFLLPSITYSGNYIFRAYTTWMKNFDPEFYFQKNITIINTIQKYPIISEKIPDSFDVHFFPEGGDLVNELQSKVAFRVTDASGKGIDFNGAIIDQNNDTIVRFYPAKFGIGNFIFTPEKNSRYKALIKPANGNVIIQSLPSVLNDGFVMMVNDSGKDKQLKIDIRTNTPDQFIYLIINTRQEVKTAEVGFFKNGNAEFQIDKKN